MLYVKDSEWDVESAGNRLIFNKDVGRVGDPEVFDITNAIDLEKGLFLYNETVFKAFDYGVTSSFDGKGCRYYIEAKVMD